MASKTSFQRDRTGQDHMKYCQCVTDIPLVFFVILYTSNMCIPYLAKSDHIAFSLLCTGNGPIQNDLQVHVSHGKGHPNPFRNRHLEVLHAPSSSCKTQVFLQILRRGKLRNCSFYIIPSPSLAHLP